MTHCQHSTLWTGPPPTMKDVPTRLASPRNAFNYNQQWQQWQNFVLDQLYTGGVSVTCIPSVAASVPAPSPTWQHFLLFCTFCCCCCCIRFHFGFFFAVSRPASRFRFYSATAVAMMIMMDNCEGLIMMTLCVMRKLARTELDPASSQLNSTRLNSLLIMQNPNRAGAEQSRGTERILYCRPCLPSCNSTQRCLAGAGGGGAEP